MFSTKDLISTQHFNKSYFFIKKRIYTVNQKGEKLKNFTYIVMEPCKLNKFQKIFSRYGKNFSDQYQKLNLDHWLCPEDNYQMNLGGSFTTDIFGFVKIEITQCQNSTTNINNWNPSCAPNESVANATQHAFNIYTTNYVVNSQDPDQKTFIAPYLNDQLYFNFFPQKLFKSVDIYYREQNIVTDQNIFYGTDLENHEIYYNDYQDFNERVDVQQGGVYAAFYFRRSIFTENVQRQFLKFADLLSYLGGFTGILLPSFAALLQIYNKYAFIIYLANKIYYFNFKGEGHQAIIPELQCEDVQQGDIQKQHTINIPQLYKDKSKDYNPNLQNDPVNNFSNKQKSSLEDSLGCGEKLNNSKVVDQKIVYKYQANKILSQIVPSIRYNQEEYNLNHQQQIHQNNPNEIINHKYYSTTVLDESQILKNAFPQTVPNQKDQEMLDFSIIDGEDQKIFHPPNLKEPSKKKPKPLQSAKSPQDNIRKKEEKSRPLQLFKKIKFQLFGLTTLTESNKTQANVFKQSFAKLFKEFKAIDYTLKWIINQFSLGILFNNQQTKITNKTIDQIYKDLDVVRLIQKDQELKKLKLIILKEQQLILFNIQPKKVIQLEEQEILTLNNLKRLASRRRSIINNKLDQLEPEYHEIQQAYKWCMAQCDESNEYQKKYFLLLENSVNNKLIDSLGVELKASFAQIQ